MGLLDPKREGGKRRGCTFGGANRHGVERLSRKLSPSPGGRGGGRQSLLGSCSSPSSGNSSVSHPCLPPPHSTYIRRGSAKTRPRPPLNALRTQSQLISMPFPYTADLQQAQGPTRSASDHTWMTGSDAQGTVTVQSF